MLGTRQEPTNDDANHVTRNLSRTYPVVMAVTALGALLLAAWAAAEAPYVRAMPLVALALVQSGTAVRCHLDGRTSVSRRRLQLLANVSGAVACALVAVAFATLLADPPALPGRRFVRWAAGLGGLDLLASVLAVLSSADQGRAR